MEAGIEDTCEVEDGTPNHDIVVSEENLFKDETALCIFLYGVSKNCGEFCSQLSQISETHVSRINSRFGMNFLASRDVYDKTSLYICLLNSDYTWYSLLKFFLKTG